MDLTPVSTTLLKARQEKDDNDSRPLLTEVTAPKTATPPRPTKITSVDEALESLRSQPDYDALILTLRYLHNGGLQSAPGPQSAAIVRLLVTEIAPNYWALLRSDGSEDIDLFIRCLRSVTGLNALVAHLRSLIQDSKGESKEVRRPDIPLNLNLLLEILDAVLKGDDAIQTLWDTSISGLSTPALQRAQSQALLSVLTGGRLVSATAEAASIAGSKDTQNEFHWITDGHQVTSWLGRNLATWAQKPPADGELRFCSDLFQRALSLGYSGEYICRLDLYDLHLTLQRYPHQVSGRFACAVVAGQARHFCANLSFLTKPSHQGAQYSPKLPL